MRFKFTPQFWLMGLVLLSFILRLYRITNPVADWHAFRQADTASVTREFVKHGINLLVPRYHDLGNIQSGLDNPEGYRMVEFPFINGLIAIFLNLFPQLDLVLVSRIFSVLASFGTLISLFYLVKNISGSKIALLSALSFAILPYSIYYSRVILPEPFFLFLSTFSLLQFLLYAKNQKLKSYLLSLFSLILAFLLKPYVAFLAPVYLVIIFQHPRLLKDFKLYLFPIISLAPFLLWRKWIASYPEGIPASDWLLNGNGIRLRPAWFRWLFYERLTKLFLGYFGWIFLLANFFKYKSKAFQIYLAWWLGVIAYFIVFATGNVQHDYYQNLALPIISISIGRGIFLLYKHFNNQKVGLSLCLILAILSLHFSWQHIKGYFNVNHWEYIHAGLAADQLLPKDAKVIVPNFGDTYFLFATNRTGWPIGDSIEEKIAKGAQFYITADFGKEYNNLVSSCQLMEKISEYAIISLTTCDFNKTKNLNDTLLSFPTEDDVSM